ncbi:MAG: YcxB family protein [Candidatus Sulfotelmatobacter sp.]
MRWLTGIAEPFSFAALGFGIYCYATGNRALAFSLFASFGYLFSEGFLLRLIRDFLSDRRRSESEHFQLETGNAGITFSVIGVSPNDGPTPSQKSWSEFRAYCETPDLFVLSSGRTCYAIPKRSLTTPEISEFQAILSGELSQRTVRTRIRGVRHAVSLVLLGYIAFFFFGGTIERALWWVFRPFRPRQTFLSSAVRLPPPASRDQLHGSGQIYLVPIGNTAPLLTPSLLQYYQSKYGLLLHVLPSIPVPEWARDQARQQLVADELIEATRRAYPQQAGSLDSILIALTDEDIYISGLDWKFALNFRQTRQALVISTARLNPVYYGKPPAPSLLEARLRKLLTKNIGISFYGLDLTGDRGSVLYRDIEDMETLDAMGEDYSVSDARVRRDVTHEAGDPCFTVRHYYSPKKQRADSAYLTGCSSTHGETDLEVLDIYLHYGMLLSRRTDFYFAGPLPLELSRVIRTQDSRPRVFGIGGNHSLNIFPVGNKWPFTWMDLILENGGRLHYRRSDWGGSYWDAIYVVEPTVTDFYSSYVAWNWPGWKLIRQDGRTYVFPDGGGVQRPEQTALIGVQDTSGNTLLLRRESTGNLASASSGEGWVRFQYDSRYRMTEAQDNAGHEVLYRYSAAGCLEEVEDAEHHVTKYGNEGTRCPTSMAIDGRQVWSAQFDKADRVTELQLADTGTYRFTYSLDGSGASTRVDIKDPWNKVLHITYDRWGYRVEQVASDDHSPALR